MSRAATWSAGEVRVAAPRDAGEVYCALSVTRWELSGDLKVLMVGSVDGHVELAVSGEIDLSTAGDLRTAVNAELDGHAGRVVLDMAAVSFIDSSGLNALIEVHQALGDRGGSLVVRSPSQAVRRLFEITALDRVIMVES